MDLYLHRFFGNDDGNSGTLYIDGKFYCYTLELPWKNNKRKISCIPAGKYQILFREDPTEMTMRYRSRFDWFNFHLCLQSVKDRSGIYIHIGNSIKDSYGCILVGSQVNQSHLLYSSTQAFKPLYLKLKAALSRAEKVQITID